MSYPDNNEVVLFIDNDEPLYRRKMAMRLNLVQKMCRGRFDPSRAPKLFSYLTDEANKRYKRDFQQTLPIPDRRAADKWYVEELQRDIRDWREHGTQDLTREELALLQSPKCKRK